MNANSSYCKSVLLYIITGLSTGGAERMLCNLLSKINRERFSPVVVSLMDHGSVGNRIAALGIPVYAIGMKTGKPTAAATWRLIHLVRQLQPDLIQGWMYHGNLAAQFANAFLAKKIPVLWSIHHSIFSLNSEKKMTIAIIKLGAQISKWPSNIIFVSQTSKLQHATLGYFSKNTCVIPNGFDTSIFIPSSEARLTIRSELGLPANSFLIGLFARYHPMKDHANFLQSAALILKANPGIHFLMAGPQVNQKNPTLHQLIQKLEISNHIHLLEERNDMPRLTAALDISSSASAYGEAFPLILGEAMSCGVPCVATNVGDSGWIVGNTGRVVPPRNPEALANAWQELINIGSKGRQALGKAARDRIIECFALDSVVNQYEKLYENLLLKKRS